VDTEPVLALLASPLLGPAVWSRVAASLVDRGRRVLVPPAVGEVAEPGDVLAALRGSLPAGTPLLLVPHSNAGLYVAALAAERDVRGVVFVDAGLPADAPWTPTAPAAFRELLAGLADPEGRLPGWTHWWPADDVGPLFPDPATRAAVEAEQPRLPLTYFDAVVPSPRGWLDLPAAYLAFGDTYATERDAARARGWPVTTLPGKHLELLRAPEAVADAIVGLVGRLGLAGGGSAPIRV
jgi:hypothetical protein